MITIEHATKVYDDSLYALRDVSISIGKEECCFILGPTGAGKTTLLNLIFGLDKPSSGKVDVLGLDPAGGDRSLLQSLKRHMGFVFQDFRLIDDWSAYDNMAVVLEMARKPWGYVRSRVWNVLAWVGLQHKVYEMAGDLSGGERQRLALARAIVHAPEILLADEPVGSVDPDTAQFMMNLIFRMNKRGMTVVIASHGSDYLLEGARVIRLEKGRIREVP